MSNPMVTEEGVVDKAERTGDRARVYFGTSVVNSMRLLTYYFSICVSAEDRCHVLPNSTVSYSI
jgi:hypothetical protein